jgi:hypothetical protein
MFTPTPIPFETLESAYLWSSAGAPSENVARLSRTTGQLFLTSAFGDCDDDLPDDIEDGSVYVAVPHQNELNLGRDLVFDFVAEHAPTHGQTVQAFFRHRGAYAQFKVWLERARLLERWYAFEVAATRNTLVAWAADNGFAVVDDPAPPRASDAT